MRENGKNSELGWDGNTSDQSTVHKTTCPLSVFRLVTTTKHALD